MCSFGTMQGVVCQGGQWVGGWALGLLEPPADWGHWVKSLPLPEPRSLIVSARWVVVETLGSIKFRNVGNIGRD